MGSNPTLSATCPSGSEISQDALGRIFPLFARVMRVGPSTCPGAKRLGSGLSRRMPSGLQDCAAQARAVVRNSHGSALHRGGTSMAADDRRGITGGENRRGVRPGTASGHRRDSERSRDASPARRAATGVERQGAAAPCGARPLPSPPRVIRRSAIGRRARPPRPFFATPRAIARR